MLCPISSRQSTALVCVLLAAVLAQEGVILAALPRDVIPLHKSSPLPTMNAVKKNSVPIAADSTLSGYLTSASYSKTECDGNPGFVVGWELNTCLGTDDNLWVIYTATGTTDDFDVTESIYSDTDCENPTGESYTYLSLAPECSECSGTNGTSTYPCETVGIFESYFFELSSDVYKKGKDNNAIEYFYYEDTSSCKKNKQSTGGSLQEYVYVGQDVCITSEVDGQASDAIFSCDDKDKDKVEVTMTTFPSTDGSCTGKSETTKETNNMDAGCSTANEAPNGMFAYIECSGKSSNGNGSAEEEVEELPVGVILAICFGVLFICAVCLIQFNDKRASDEEKMLRTNPGDKKIVVLFSNRA